MGYEFETEELFECDCCGALLPGDLMVFCENDEVYCEECYEEMWVEEGE